MSTTISHTYDVLQEENQKEWKKFMRRVIRDNEKFDHKESWKIEADERNTSQKVTFYRYCKPAQIGDPEVRITIDTDMPLSMRCSRAFSGGWGEGKPFDDAKPVYLPKPRGFMVTSSYDVSTIADAMSRGWRLKVSGERGSTNSSEYGLGFYRLNLVSRHGNFSEVTVDSTVTINGRVVIAGSVRV